MSNEQQWVLSEEEKRRIRAEMILREELRRELKLIEPPAKQESSLRRYAVLIFDALNKPFFITILFGGLLSFITLKVQQRAALKEKERTYLQASQERKFQLLSSFDASFNNSFSSRLHYSSKLYWVNSYRDDPKAFPGGRAEYYKAMNDLEAKWKDLSALPTYNGLCAQVKSLFDSEEVKGRAEELRVAAEKSRRMPVASDADVDAILDSVLPKLEGLLLAMGQEIKNPPQTQ